MLTLRPRLTHSRTGSPLRYSQPFGILLCLILMWASAAQAQSTSASAHVAENTTGLPGFVRVAAPVPSSGLLALGASGSFGLYSPIGSSTGPSQQYTGHLAIGVTPLPYLAARLSLRGDYTHHAPDPVEPQSSLYGEPELGVRVQFPVFKSAYVGGEAEARFIGAEAPDLDFSATTVTLRALFAYHFKRGTWLSGQLGYRLDNSAQAIDDPERLHDGDRQTLHASSFDAVELGVAASHRWGAFELLGEVSADILVGKGAPSFAEGPISLDVGGRYDVTRDFNVRAHLEVSPSAIADPYPIDTLISTRPRFLMGLGLTYRFFPREHAKKEPAAAPVSQAKPAPVQAAVAVVVAPPSGRVQGRVQDEGGRPIADVQVLLVREDGPPVETFTDANGHFVFEDVTPGKGSVTVKTPGYDPLSKNVEVRDDETFNLHYTMYESLPAGQLRGRVLDFAGRPLVATVTVSPGDVVVPVAADGAFSIDLKPGRYKVHFAHEGYANQVRVVRVQDKGVVVVNIALEK